MAGFEVIVRPVVFPSIRPQPTRALPPEDDPEQGIATIGGSGGRVLDLTYSYSVSISRSYLSIEEARAQDHVRVYQEEDDGEGRKKVNKNNYIDFYAVYARRVRDQSDEVREEQYPRVKESKNVEIKETDIVTWTKDGGTTAAP